jgi:hypothetical protein
MTAFTSCSQSMPAIVSRKRHRQVKHSIPSHSKSVRFTDSSPTTIPLKAASQPETWYQALDYTNFQSERRSALLSLLRSRIKDEPLHISEYVGMEQHLSREQYISRKLQCLQYVQLVVCQQYMDDKALDEVTAVTRCFTEEAGQTALVRAVTAIIEDR